MPSVLSRPLYLPPEILFDILYATLYTGHEFGGRLEYEDPTSRHHVFAINHAWFKDSVLCTSKQFYETGITLLWRFLIIRSRISLQNIHTVLKTGGFLVGAGQHGAYVRRLHLRISGGFDPRLVGELTTFMPQLKVFILRNDSAPPSRPFPLSPKCLLLALAKNTPDVVRVQLESAEQQPNQSDVLHLLNALPKLRTLRLYNVTLGPCKSCNCLQRSHPPHPSLRILSVGPDHDLYSPNTELAGLTGTCAMLAMRIRLPRLVRSLLYTWTPKTHALLETYGAQIKALVYTTPSISTIEEANFLRSCPRLRELLYIVPDPCHLPPSQRFPDGHSHVQVVHLMFIKFRDDSTPLYVACVQDTVRTLLEGTYPSLFLVTVAQQGYELPDLARTSWFRYYGRCFKKEGISLEAIVPNVMRE